MTQKTSLQLTAIYLAVKDMDRAVRFYEKILGKKVDVKDKRMSQFNLDNIVFLLYDPAQDKGEVTYGENAVVCFQVEDLQAMYKLIKKENCPTTEIKTIDNYAYFQAKDPEGNIVEFYKVISNFSH